jgi:hypothetical protein
MEHDKYKKKYKKYMLKIFNMYGGKVCDNTKLILYDFNFRIDLNLDHVLFGGKYIMNYIASGKYANVFNFADKFVIRISKFPDTPIKNINIYKKINELKSENFLKYMTDGECKSDIIIDSHVSEFCNNTDGKYTYFYVILGHVNGLTLEKIFINHFTNIINDPNFDISNEKTASKINLFLKFYLNLIIKLVQALYLADKELGFRHNDLHYDNVLIQNFESNDVIPVIIDYDHVLLNVNNEKNEFEDIRKYCINPFSSEFLNEYYAANVGKYRQIINYMRNDKIILYIEDLIIDGFIVTRTLKNILDNLIDFQKNIAL